MMEDATGLPLACGNLEAMDSFNRGLTACVTLRENPVPWFKEALERDSSLAIAHSVVVSCS